MATWEVDENGDIIDSNSTNTESEEVTDLPTSLWPQQRPHNETDEDEDEDGGALDDIMVLNQL